MTGRLPLTNRWPTGTLKLLPFSHLIRGTHMPTIVFASPKGGAGKSTSAVLLASELALKGAGGTVLDADPNKPVSHWAARGGSPEQLTVIADLSESTIFDEIDK